MLHGDEGSEGVVALDGEWDVARLGGLLPPLPLVRKRIEGGRGATILGPLPLAPFSVRGLRLRYPLGLVVDVLEPDGAGFRGRTLVLGRPVGSFSLRRRQPPGDGPQTV